MSQKHATDWILPVGFLCGGALEAWIGHGGWVGLCWWFLTFASGAVLGAIFLERRE